MKQIAIRLGEQTTLAKSLVISSKLDVKLTQGEGVTPGICYLEMEYKKP